MTSEELQNHINQTVSSRLDPETYRKETEGTVRPCPDCRAAYEGEMAQKMVVRKRYLTGASTGSMPEAMERSLEAISRAESRRRSSYQSRSRSSGMLMPLLIFLSLALAVGAYVILSDDTPDSSEGESTQETSSSSRQPIPEPTRRSTGPVNFFNQGIANYESLISGKLQVEYEKANLADLKEEFSKNGVPNTTFKGVSMPLEGGVVSERNGVHLPHFLYKDGESYFYVTELPITTLKEGKGFYVTEDVLAQIEGGENIWMEAPAKGNLVLYKDGESVIVAVANRSRVDMKRLLGLP